MSSPAVLSRVLSGGRVTKLRVLTKDDKITKPSLEFYREFYRDVLPQLQARLPEEKDSDALIEVLAEWQGNVDTAERKYKETVEWRRTTLPVPYEEVKLSIQTGKFVFHGYDKVGRGVVYYRTCLHDPKDFTPQQTLRHAIYNYELLLDQLAKAGRSIKEVTVVVDRTNASRKNTDVEFLKEFYKVFKDHYPARGEVFVIYGVNWVFRGIWAMVKPFLDNKSQGSTFMVNSKRELCEFIDESQLPEYMCGPGSPSGSPAKLPPLEKKSSSFFRSPFSRRSPSVKSLGLTSPMPGTDGAMPSPGPSTGS